MKKVFYALEDLDKRCYEEFYLSEDLLMEHAAQELSKQIRKRLKKGKKILYICGSGNNGADGIASARILHKDYEVALFMPLSQKSQMAKLQLKRAKALGIKLLTHLEEADCYVDCLFGSGFKKQMSEEISFLIHTLNQKIGIKIACDIPSGIDADGYIQNEAFNADVTVSMGALKEALYSDIAKEYVGTIKVANLGVSRQVYETNSDVFVLEKEDLKLPVRAKKNTHKGEFGHTCILSGEKSGASILSATAAFNLGSGLVSIIAKEIENIPPFLIKSHHLPHNVSVVVAGMGLGEIENELLYEYLLSHPKPLVIDADLFYQEVILEILEKKKNIVLTPHPKEFCALLKLTNLAQISVNELQNHRMRYVKMFAKKYPHITLLLKGANTLITHKEKVYINPLGDTRLSKGGSGDVLAGFIGSLIAQGYTNLEASIHASLAHVLSVKKMKIASYALNPLDICEGIKWLQKK